MGIRDEFEFKPSDEAILSCLLNRVFGSCSLAWWADDDLIGTDDLYGSKEPWEVFGGDRKEKERLFFTELKRVGRCKTKGRVCRSVGKGYWSNKGQRKLIYGQNGGMIGYKRSYRYERKKGQNSSQSEDDSDWLMKEYLLPEYVMREAKEKYTNFALCVVRRKKKKKGGCGRPVVVEEEPPINFKIKREWLRQRLGDDVVYDDDAPPCDRAPTEPVDNLTGVVEEEDDECSMIPVVDVPNEIDEEDVVDGSVNDDDQLLGIPVVVEPNEIHELLFQQLPPTVTEDECSIAPPFDFSTSFEKEGGQNTVFLFGDCRAAPSHFAWDDDYLFGDRYPAWAGMLPVPVV